MLVAFFFLSFQVSLTNSFKTAPSLPLQTYLFQILAQYIQLNPFPSNLFKIEQSSILLKGLNI